jgi:hypothetical protein
MTASGMALFLPETIARMPISLIELVSPVSHVVLLDPDHLGRAEVTARCLGGTRWYSRQ